jgi:DivIVA domain-containing protein
VSLPVLIVVLVVALLVFGIAAAAVDRLPGLVPAEPDEAGDGLPVAGFTAADLPRVRFGLALRGYRCSDVDAFVSRVAVELDKRDHGASWPTPMQDPEVLELVDAPPAEPLSS